MKIPSSIGMGTRTRLGNIIMPFLELVLLSDYLC